MVLLVSRRVPFRWWRHSRPVTYERPWPRRAVHFVATSPVLLWTLLRLHRRLERGGLRAAVEAAAPAHRRPRGGVLRLDDWTQQMRACHEDDLVSWWLTRFRVRAICLYRCLVMLDRLSRLPRIQTLELVIGARRASGGLGAHAWIVGNGRDFRRDPGTSHRLGVLGRV